MIAKTKGMSVLGFLFMALLIGIVAMIAIKLTPAYLTHFTIKNAMTDLAKAPDAAEMSETKLRDLLNRKLQVNSIKNVSADSLEVEKEKNNQWLVLDYEIRSHVIANIDAVMIFKERVSMSENK